MKFLKLLCLTRNLELKEIHLNIFNIVDIYEPKDQALAEYSPEHAELDTTKICAVGLVNGGELILAYPIAEFMKMLEDAK